MKSEQAAVKTSEVANKLSYQEMLSFYIPLAFSAILMMTSHSIISSAMAKTTQAEIAIAAFAVASSISMMFESPCYNIRRMAVALFDDQVSLDNIFKVGLSVLAVCLAAMIPIAFTDFGKVVFINWVGIKPDIFPAVIKSFRIFMLLPIVSAVRGFYQGILIVRKKTYWLSINIVVRLGVMLALTGIVPNLEWIADGIVGAVILVCGIGTEALLAFISSRLYRKEFPSEPVRFEKSVSIKDAYIFFLPIIAAVFAQTFSRPGINAGLARTINPEQALASYQVAYSFAMIFVASLFSIHQLVLVFGKDKNSFKMLTKFSGILSVSMTGMLLICGLTPVGKWVLTNIIGVEYALTELALKAITFYSFIPILLCGIEIFSGLLMMNMRTPVITLAKTCNVIMVILVATSLSALFPELGGVIGSLSMTFGAVAELIIVFWKSRDLIFA